jgi:hypothetical protein
MAEWYKGFDPRGQFYNKKVEYYGMEVSLGFWRSVSRRVLIIRQLNTISRHSRLSGIERLNMLNIKKDSGQAGMGKLTNLLDGLIGYVN